MDILIVISTYAIVNISAVGNKGTHAA